jgi:hypothetical protein
MAPMLLGFFDSITITFLLTSFRVAPISINYKVMYLTYTFPNLQIRARSMLLSFFDSQFREMLLSFLEVVVKITTYTFKNPF